MSWGHLEQLYLDDTGGPQAVPQQGGVIRQVKKLRYEHVYLTTFSKMRVDLAAQVSSQECG